MKRNFIHKNLSLKVLMACTIFSINSAYADEIQEFTLDPMIVTAT